MFKSVAVWQVKSVAVWQVKSVALWQVKFGKIPEPLVSYIDVTFIQMCIVK